MISSSLRRQWALTGLLWAAVWLVCYGLLRPIWPWSGRWLFLSGIALAYGLMVLWRHLPSNHRAGETELLDSIGPGNALTLARGLCIGLLAGFLFAPWPPGALAWLIVLLYTLADVADYFDGYLARRAGHVTVLGSALDMEFDGMGTLVVILLAVSFGQLPLWYVALGFARYLFVFGLWVRRRAGLPIHEMPPSAHRRVFAGFQMGFLSVVLWPILPRPMAVIAGTLFAIATGLGFLRDWLVATGTINTAQPAYLQIQQALYRLFAQRLPLLWRSLLALATAAILRAATPPYPPGAWQELLAGWGMPVPVFFAWFIVLMMIIGTPLVALGILGRALSIALSLPIGFDIATRGLQWSNGIALVSIVFLQLLGPGPLALWPVEERYIFHRLGER